MVVTVGIGAETMGVVCCFGRTLGGDVVVTVGVGNNGSGLLLWKDTRW